MRESFIPSVREYAKRYQITSSRLRPGQLLMHPGPVNRGIELSAEQCRPVCDPITLESNVPGIYVAGVIVAGSRTNEIFIENGRFHGQQIAEDLKQKLGRKS